ncbi:hypothetical protein F4703DRAFT_1798044 [Phycomyces blakesleeanus]
MYKQTKIIVLNKVARIFKKSAQTSIAPALGASKILNSLDTVEKDQNYMYQDTKINTQSIHTLVLSPDLRYKADTESDSIITSQSLLGSGLISQKNISPIEAAFSTLESNEKIDSTKSFTSMDRIFLGSEEPKTNEYSAPSDNLNKSQGSEDNQGLHSNISLKSLSHQTSIFVETTESSTKPSQQTIDEKIALFRKLMSVDPCLPNSVSQRNMLSYEDSLFSICSPPSFDTGKKSREGHSFSNNSLTSVAKMSLKSVPGSIITPIQQRVSIRDRIKTYNSVPNSTPVNAPKALNVKRIKVLNKVALWEAVTAKTRPPIPVLHILQAQVECDRSFFWHSLL